MSNRKPIEVGQTVTVTGTVVDVRRGEVLTTVTLSIDPPRENRPTSTPRANRPEATT